jgi:hypothetical protein
MSPHDMASPKSRHDLKILAPGLAASPDIPNPTDSQHRPPRGPDKVGQRGLYGAEDGSPALHLTLCIRTREVSRRLRIGSTRVITPRLDTLGIGRTSSGARMSHRPTVSSDRTTGAANPQRWSGQRGVLRRVTEGGDQMGRSKRRTRGRTGEEGGWSSLHLAP